MLRSLTLLLALGASVFALWLWWAQPEERLDMAAYHDALDNRPGSTAAIDAGLQAFSDAFADLSAAETAERMAALYADDAFFNDTVVTLRSGQAIADYMGKTGSQLDASSVSIDHQLRDGADVFVRWQMHFNTSAFGMKIESKSIGMTHLRFDDQGRVILHQDFWDAAGGLYEHLPLIGSVIRTAKRMMPH